MTSMVYADDAVGRRMLGLRGLGSDRTSAERYKIIGEWLAQYRPRMELVRSGKAVEALRAQLSPLAAAYSKLAPAFAAGAVAGERDAAAVEDLYYRVRDWYNAVKAAEVAYGSNAPGALPPGPDPLAPPPMPPPAPNPLRPPPPPPAEASAGLPGWVIPVGAGVLLLALGGGIFGRRGR